MNPRTKPVPSAALYPAAANEGETPITGFPGDVQDLFNLGIGELLELERASMACAIEIYRNVFCLPQFFAPFLETTAMSVQSCLELQINWLDLLTPGAGNMTASSASAMQDPPAPEEIEAEYAEDFIVATFENY